MTSPGQLSTPGDDAAGRGEPGLTRRVLRQGVPTPRRRRLRLRPALALALAGMVAGVGSGAALGHLSPGPAPTVTAEEASVVEGSGASLRAQGLDTASRGNERTALDDMLEASAQTAAPEPAVEPPAEPVLEADAALEVVDPVVLPDGVTLEDLAAGVLSASVPTSGTGVLDVVPGEVPAPGAGAVTTVRVEVEGGLEIDGAAFAATVMDTLNDPRSWGGDGSQTFARTTGEAAITVTLASPTTVDRLCAPLDTEGTWSCGVEGRAVLNHLRWIEGSGIYGDQMVAYRQYLVNHEVGHVLGYGHRSCGASSTLAPVMVQQSGASLSCVPNGWPFPG